MKLDSDDLDYIAEKVHKEALILMDKVERRNRK